MVPQILCLVSLILHTMNNINVVLTCLIFQVMKLIGENFDKIPKSSDVVGLMENDPEYQLIVEANNIAAEVDAEISRFY